VVLTAFSCLFCVVVRRASFASPTCLWSSDLRAVLMTALKTQVRLLRCEHEHACAKAHAPSLVVLQMEPYRAWVLGTASDEALTALHPCAPVDTNARVRAAAAGLRSIPQLRALSAPFAVDAACSSRRLLCVPPTMHSPVPVPVAYAALEEEPRVAGVYLRV
jgi:hypothetical protein